MSLDRPFAETAAIRSELGAIFISLELTCSTWLTTSLSPGAGEKLVEARDQGGRCFRVARSAGGAQTQGAGADWTSHPIIVIQEAGLDGFWLHRVSCRRRDARAMWSTRPRSPRRAADDGPRRTGSTARRCCARCSPTSAANPGFARWCGRRRPRRRTSDGFVASARN